MSKVLDAIEYAFKNNQAATSILLAERWLLDHPNDLWTIHKYAEMLYLMTRYDDAIRVYTEAIERFDGDYRWGFYNQLGHLFRYRGDFQEAEKWYRKASEEDPDEAASFIFLGSVQARQGNLIAAEISHRQATLCKHGCIDEAYLNLGYVLRGQGRYTEAAECFQKAIELCSNYEEAIQALEDIKRVTELLASPYPPRG